MYEKNLWQLIFSDELLETMRLLGCDKKYLSGQTSDFECFRVWIDAYTYMDGNEVAENAAKNIERITGRKMTYSDLCRADASLIWQCHCGENNGINIYKLSDEKLYNISKFDRIIYCDEKEKNMSHFVNVSHLITEARDNELNDVEMFEKHLYTFGTNQFGMTVTDDEFTRPDRYHCWQYYSEYISGEKQKNNFILSQIILDMIYQKRCEIIHLLVDDEKGRVWANDFIRYLSFRELSVRIAVHFSKNITPKAVKETCLISDHVVPVLPSCEEEYVRPFAKIIPRGILAFENKKD